MKKSFKKLNNLFNDIEIEKNLNQQLTPKY